MGRAPESNGGEMGTTVIEPQLKKKKECIGQRGDRNIKQLNI